MKNASIHKNGLLYKVQQSGKNDILSKEKEQELIKRAQNGDKEAESDLICHNIRLIYTIANKFSNKGLDIEDLVQEGAIGLQSAIQKFTLEKDFRLSTYAYYWILQRVNLALTKKGKAIYVPPSYKAILIKARRAEEKLLNNNEEVTYAKIASIIGVKEEKVTIAMENFKPLLSLNFEKTDEEEEGEQAPLQCLEQSFFVEPQEEFEEKEYIRERREDILRALDTLSPKHKEVILYRYGFDVEGGLDKKRTLEEVANLVGDITRERVRQIEKKVLELLSAPKGRTGRRRAIEKYKMDIV